MKVINQQGLTLIIPVKGGLEEQLKSFVAGLDTTAEFGQLQQLHFMSMTILPPSAGEFDHSLMIELNIDEKLQGFVNELWQHCQPCLLELLASCDVVLPASAADLLNLVQKYNEGPGTYFAALRGADVGMIRKSAELKAAAAEVCRAAAGTYDYPRELCAKLAADTSVSEHFQSLPVRWPGDKAQAVWVVVQFAWTYSLCGIVLAGAGAPFIYGAPAAVTEIRLWHWGFLFAVIILLVALFVQTLQQDLASRKANYLKLTIVFFAAILLGLCLGAIDLQGSMTSLMLEILLLPGWALLVLYALWLSRTTAPADYYILRISKPLLLPVFVLLLLQTDLFLSLGGNLVIAAAVAAAVLCAALGYAIVVAYIAARIAGNANKAGTIAPVLALLTVTSLPESVLISIHPFAQALVFLLLVIVCAYIWAICKLEWQEQRDFESLPVWPASARRTAISLQETGNYLEQNHLISYTTIKPGRLRLATLYLVLFVVGQLNRLQGTRSELSGIVTIHFARWLIVDNKYLLFLTNYSGTWDSYLDEFIDQSRAGLTAIWSNTAGFPRARWLTEGGAELEQRFKIYARRSQLETLCHYRAYPLLSVNQIEENLRLNTILQDNKRTDADCETVLRML